jgi:oligopeptide transport system substrate-binding protein
LNLAVASLFVLSACQTSGTTTVPAPAATGPAAGSAPRPNQPPAGVKQEIVFNNLSEPASLDPALFTDNVSGNLAQQLYEGLTFYDPKTLEPRPGVAEKWEVSADGKIYTFTLRENAKWSNGEQVTADDYVYSWTRTLSPIIKESGKAAPYVEKLKYLKNGLAYNKGDIKDASQIGVRAKDKRTLEVTLENPTPYFLSLTSFYTLYPVHKATVEKFGADWTKPGNLVGNGAFKLSEWAVKDKIVLLKNEHYWDAKNVWLEKVTALPTEDSDTATAQFEKGEIDWSRTIPARAIDQWKGKPETQIWPGLTLQYVSLNFKRPPVNDARVRKALYLAIDRKSLVEKVLKDGSIPAYTAVPPTFDGYNTGTGALAPKGLGEDVTQAKRLLSEAGFPDGRGFPRITVYYNTNPTHKVVYEFLQQEWKDKLGIDITIENMEFPVLIEKRQRHDFEMARNGWGADYVDPNTFLGDLFVTGVGNNVEDYSNPKFDDLIKQAGSTQDKATRYKALAEAEKILIEQDTAIVPLYFSAHRNLTKTWIKGMSYNGLEWHYLKFVYTEGKK